MKQKTMTVYYNASPSGNNVPMIRFQGQWLSTHGFDIGTNYKLTATDNKIIIEKILPVVDHNN